MNSIFNPDSDLLFPLRVVPMLREIRGQEWEEFIDSHLRPDITYAEQLAFVVQMARMGSCASCDSDSYRAMKGCTACARQTIKRYKGNDKELIQQFTLTLKDIQDYLDKR